ncbi:hypothetical protein PtB15_6B528 [Puccinia triticina]|nr:hypothetical protein PtB15_6B528 [Puccinia triticina]
MCLNMYDVRLVDTYPACGLTWPPDLADITPYLSRTDVKKVLHAQDHSADGRMRGQSRQQFLG